MTEGKKDKEWKINRKRKGSKEGREGQRREKRRNRRGREEEKERETNKLDRRGTSRGRAFAWDVASPSLRNLPRAAQKFQARKQLARPSPGCTLRLLPLSSQGFRPPSGHRPLLHCGQMAMQRVSWPSCHSRPRTTLCLGAGRRAPALGPAPPAWAHRHRDALG